MTARAGELPPLLSLLAAPAALLPLGPLLANGLRGLARRKPEVFERLGEHRRCVYVIAPTDVALVFSVIPDGRLAKVAVTTRPAEGDVLIRGPILALIGILDGTLDGDALFFGRTIAVSGRTDALLALRNAMEDAELKPSDLLGIRGWAARLADWHVPAAVAALRARTALSEEARP